MSDPKQPNGANAPSGTAAASPSGSEDLDALLTDFKGTNEPGKTPDISKLIRGIEPVVRFAEGAKAKEEAAARQKVVDESVAAVKGAEELKDLDGEVVEGFLINRYQKNAEFRAAHDHRAENPDNWTKALAKAQEDLKGKMKALPGNTVRSDLEAATAAVRGSSTKPPADDEGPSLDDKINMNDQQWRAHLRKRETARLARR